MLHRLLPLPTTGRVCSYAVHCSLSFGSVDATNAIRKKSSLPFTSIAAHGCRLGVSSGIPIVSINLALKRNHGRKKTYGFLLTRQNSAPHKICNRRLHFSFDNTMRVLSGIATASLLAAPSLVTGFSPNPSMNQPTVVQRAIMSKWTMMPEEPEPEVGP